MTALHLPASSHWSVSRGSCIRLSRFALGLIAMAWAVGAHAFVTVGPHGLHPTIQEGINQAIANGGDEVRVELWLHNNPNGSSTVVPYVENITYDPLGNFQAPASVTVSGGWHADFQSQYNLPGGGIQGSLVQGTGANAPIIKVFAIGSAIVAIRNFDFNGNNNTAGFQTRGIFAGARHSSVVTISDNSIHNINLLTSVSDSNSGGAGMAVQATDSAVIYIAGNTIQSNKSIGTDTQPTYGGGAFVSAIGGGHVDFVLNTITGNFSSNSNGGGCRGGGVWAAALDSSTMQLRGNKYTGNAQIFCSTSATGDAAEIDASNTAVINVYDETWTNNNTASNPGVYEVYMQADVSSHISAQNGLITHGTWGGLLANSIASGSIDISNYTIADNPVLGFHGFGIGTELWNTVLWNNGNNTPVLETGSTVGFSLFGTDPHFVNAASGNYRLLYGSPAINFGTNTPTGGLRLVDLDGAIRPYQGVADAGAYEWRPDPTDLIFANGFD